MRCYRVLVLLLLLAFSSTALAIDFVYATKDVTARRWRDSETPTVGDIKKDEKLQVIFRKEGWARVRNPKTKGFGWVPEEAITETAPEGAAASPSHPGMPNLPVKLNVAPSKTEGEKSE